MDQEYITEYDSVVASLAVEYHRRYPMVDALDIQQMLWLWFVTHPTKYAEWSALDQKDKDKLIAKSLRNAAVKYCEKEKAKTVEYTTYWIPVPIVSTEQVTLSTVLCSSTLSVRE